MEQSYAPASPRPPRIGDWLSEAFRLFGQEWQVWLGQGAIYTLLAAGPALAGYLFFYLSFVVVAMSAQGKPSAGPPPEIWAALSGGLGIFGVSLIVSAVLSAWLLVGMERTAARQLRGEPIAVRDIFSGGDAVLPMLGASLLVGLVTGIASIFCYVPGLLLAGMLSFVTPLIAEGRMGVLDAMRKSWDVTRPYMWLYLVWIFLIALIGSMGMNLCFIGFAVTWPIFILALMVAYRDAVGIPGALPPATRPTPPYPRQ